MIFHGVSWRWLYTRQERVQTLVILYSPALLPRLKVNKRKQFLMSLSSSEEEH